MWRTLGVDSVLMGLLMSWAAVVAAQEVVIETFEDRSIAPLLLETDETTIAAVSPNRFGNNYLRVRHDSDESIGYLGYYVQQPQTWQSVDVEFRTRFPTGIPLPSDGAVKQSRVVDSRGAELFTISIHFHPDLGGYYLNYQTGIDGNSAAGNIPMTLRRNRWDTLRYRAVFNPRGQSTGVFQIWFNGVLVADRGDVDFFQGETTPITPNLVLVGMNANVFDKSTADQWIPFDRDIDDVRIEINP